MQLPRNRFTSFTLISYRRRNCLIYSVLFIFLVTLIGHKIYKITRTWTDKDWEKLRPSGGVVNYQHDYVIPGKPACDDSIKLVIIIFSRPDAFSTRSVLRSTWLSPRFIGPQFSSIVYRFILGNIKDPKMLTEVVKESRRHGDIIMDSTFTDSYDLLVLKTISMINWVNKNCPKTEALLKTDDDSWINVKRIVDILPDLEPGIHGHVYWYSGSSTDPKDTWYMPIELYPFNHYPDFTSGSGYLIVNRNFDIYDKLNSAIATIRTIWTEDVFLTGLVAEKAQIKRYNHEGFNPTKVPIDDICRYRILISSHKLTAQDMDKIYTSIQDSNIKCETS